MAGEIQLNSTSFASESGGTITINNATLASAVDLSNHYASTSEIQGTHTTFSGSHSDTATTINLASVSGISAGDYVVGEGITPGTTVSSVGASSVVISAGLDTDSVGIAGGEPISFYKADKVLSPGLVAGGLCRAWVRFDGRTGAPDIDGAFNCSSIGDEGAGRYIFNLTTAMPDSDYCVTTSGSREESATNCQDDSVRAQEFGTTSFKLHSNSRRADGSFLVDFYNVCAAVFR